MIKRKDNEDMKIQPKLVKAFMDALRSAIAEEGLRALAERAGVSHSTISNWLNRGSVPTLDAVVLVAKAIKFDLGPHS